MRITIIGVGAMGSLFAGRLSPLSDVTMLGQWEAQLKILNEKGITLLHPNGRRSQYPLKATNDPTSIPAADLVLIMVKTPKTAAAAEHAATILKPDGLVISLQNGLGNLETIANIVGPERAVQGVTSEGAAMLEAGVVRHAGAGQTYLATGVLTGLPTGEQRMAQLKETAALFNKAEFETELVEQADSLIWGKLAVNAGINPLTALLQVPNGFLVENEAARQLMSRAASEAAVVAQALHIPLPYDDAAERAEQVAQATAANHSSMAQDVARGVPTEIEAICGAVVRHGQQLGVPTPINRAWQELIQRQTTTGQWQDALENQPPDIRRAMRQLIKGESSVIGRTPAGDW